MLTLNQLTSPAASRHPLLSEREQRAALIGVVCTIAFHVLLFVIAPFFPAESFTGTHSNLEAVAASRAKTFDIELTPEEENPIQNPFKFVETNPDAPENEPDKTDNVSNRNQQSAQPEKSDLIDPDNRPATKGREDLQSDAIVSGNRTKPEEGGPPVAEALQEVLPQAAQVARAQQVPLSGTEKIEGKSEDGIGSNVSNRPMPSTNAPEFLEGTKDGQSPTGAMLATPQVNRQIPRERPRLASASTARSTVLQNRIQGTRNVGPIGIDARWSEYGDYMNELIEIVDAEWHSILNNYRGHVASSASVAIEFKLNADGEVKIVSVEETAGRVAVNQCQSAITNRMPYRKWTEQMKAVLGDEQTITFRFFYQ